LLAHKIILFHQSNKYVTERADDDAVNTLTESSSVLILCWFILHSDVTYSLHGRSVGWGFDIRNSLFRMLQFLTTCLDQSYQAQEILSEERFVKISRNRVLYVAVSIPTSYLVTREALEIDTAT